MENDERAVLKTLLYADFFNYPHTEKEIEKFLTLKVSRQKLRSILKNSKDISFKDGFYCLKGKEKNINLRKKREKEAEKKIQKAKKSLFFLSKIPSILLIGISGSIAAGNARKEDDIDLFVITENKSLWITRFLMVIYLKSFGLYRNRSEKNFRDKFCLNMFLTEKSMVFNKERRNIYTAREIAQMIPVFQRDNAYDSFIKSNNWIRQILPNVWKQLRESKEIKNHKRRNLENKILSILNSPFKKLQLVKIRKNLTTETIEDDFLAFHNRDMMKEILGKYKNILE